LGKGVRVRVRVGVGPSGVRVRLGVSVTTVAEGVGDGGGVGVLVAEAAGGAVETGADVRVGDTTAIMPGVPVAVAQMPPGSTVGSGPAGVGKRVRSSWIFSMMAVLTGAKKVTSQGM
jgi:ABC-type transporter Mla maintaining outer membrane lipid asymmetry permease subunit MlaE